MKRISDIIIIAAWLTMAIGAASCRSAHITKNKSQTDSTATVAARVIESKSAVDSTTKESKDSSGTVSNSEYERETVIEDYTKLNSEPSKDSLHVPDSCKGKGVFLARRTTIREKGKVAIAITDTKSKREAVHTSEYQYRDTLGNSKISVKTNTVNKETERTVSGWNWLWLVALVAVGYVCYRTYKKYA